MPAAYAHYCFGRDVLSRLPGSLASELESRRSFFDLGLQGPDPLFYYQPLRSNAVGRRGSLIHSQAASDFFRPAGELLRRSPSPELYAYICGFICHFVLDLHCHGYIAAAADRGGPGHGEQEADLDRLLLKAQGLNICPGVRLRQLRPSLAAARLISPLFPGLSPMQLYRSMLGMKFFDAFLAVRKGPVLELVLGGLRLLGQREKLGGMLLSSPPAPGCESSSPELLELFDQAVDAALRLIGDFARCAQGRMDYDPLYKYNFDSCLLKAGGSRET